MFKPSLREQIVSGTSKPFESCHASHLAVLPNGDVLAAWFAGSREGADDIGIWVARRSAGVWSAPFVLVNEEGAPHWNPVFFQQDNGTLLLFYKVGRLLKEWVTKVKKSTDNGMTWSDPVELVPGDSSGGRGPVRNKVIVLSDGTWLAPGSTEDGIWTAFADRSSNEGASWTKSNEIRINGLTYEASRKVDSDIPVSEQSFHGRGVIQPTLWESENGHVHMMLRSTEGRIYRSDSTDYGATWCDAYPTELPNNNSGIDAVKMATGLLAIVFNPVEINWGPRSPLQISFSRDNGTTWTDGLTLENDEGEYSYPAVLAKGNELFLTYTWQRTNIIFQQIKVSP